MLKLKFYKIHFVFIIFLICPLNYLEAQDNIQILKDIENEKLEYKFVVLPEDTPLISSFPIEKLQNDPDIKSIESTPGLYGNSYSVIIDSGDEKDVRVGFSYHIHSSIENARIDMMEDLNPYTSAFLRVNALDYKTEHKFGDNCCYWIDNWNNDDIVTDNEIRSVIFLRNNINITVGNKNVHDTPSAFITVAEKIDKALIDCEKISYSSLIGKMPIINSVDIIGSLIAGSTDETKISIKATDPMNEKLIYTKYATSWRQYNGEYNWFSDKAPGKTYKILVWVINESNYWALARKEGITFLDPTSVEDEGNTAEVPKVFELYQNRPNPFNPATVISYDLSKQSDVVLTIHDTLGRKVWTLANSSMNPGKHEILWDGRDVSGNDVSSGIYYCRINADGHTGAIGMTLVR